MSAPLFGANAILAWTKGSMDNAENRGMGIYEILKDSARYLSNPKFSP